MMPYRPFQNQNRVEYIKRKFENSILEGNDNALKPANNSVPYKTKPFEKTKDLNVGKNLSKRNLKTETIENTLNKTDSKALIKRTPAFRRDKVSCTKNLTKEPKQDTPQQKNESSSQELQNNVKKNDGNVWTELKRSKTDTNLLKYCDNRNKNSVNKISTKPSSVDIIEDNVDDKILAQYAVVEKNKKKNCVKQVDLKLTESIRRALQSPLPKGPPPKKPPRTFCHIPQTSSTSHCNPKPHSPKSDIPKLKSKLDKLEKVIKTHNLDAQISQPKEDFKNYLQKKLNKIPVTVESHVTNVSNKKAENQSCLKFLNQCTSAQAYEKLIVKNSEFYLDADISEPILRGSVASESNDGLKLSTLAVKRSSSEPIYDLPCVNKKNQFETFGKCSKDETHLKTKKAEEGLHYMCTDVVKQVPVLSSFANFDRKIRSGGEIKAGNIETKSKFSTISGRTMFINSSNSDNDKKHVIERVSNLVTTNETAKRLNEPVDSAKNSSDSESDTASVSSSALSNDKDGKMVDGEKLSKVKKSEEISQMTAKRKMYLNRVSSKLCGPSPYWKCISKSSCSHLFECCMLVGLTLCESKKNVPYIKSIYPPEVKPPPLIESLCFPDASYWPPSSENQEPEEQYYSLVVTNENGERKFGYCRRVLPEGGHFCLPLTYCIISPHRASGFYYKVLERLESKHGSSEIENFIKQLYESQFPGPGGRLKLNEILEEASRSSPQPEKYSSSTLLRRPCDVRLEETHLNLLFEQIQISVILKVFSSLLHERKVLLLSHSLRKLSSCTEALHLILYPFLWQHTYIPVLPVDLIEMCEAPTPYVIGILKFKNIEDSLAGLNFEDGIIVDLDDSKVMKCCGDEKSILPPSLIKDLKTALNLAISTRDSSQTILISDAFIRFFVQVCGTYSKFIFCQPNGEKIFEKEEFIKSFTSNSIQVFLEWFTETAMFNSFIQENLHGETEDMFVKLFRIRAVEYSEESIKNSTVLLKNYKVINRKVRTLGDKIKDFTSFNR